MQATALKLYKPGDKLEIYKPGDAIGPENLSWSLLFLKWREFAFAAASKSLTARLANVLNDRNMVYIGDTVTQTEDKIKTRVDDDRWRTINGKSFDLLARSITGIGLNFGLVCPNWPPEYLENTERSLPRSPGGGATISVNDYLRDVVRPNGVS